VSPCRFYRLVPLPLTGGPGMAVMKPDTHGVKTHWIRGFMTFELARRTQSAVLMVPVGSESGFRSAAA
jgi:hypothetical protein